MKKATLFRRFLLAVATLGIGFIMIFVQKAVLPAHLQHLNARTVLSNQKMKSVEEPLEAISPRDAPNSSMTLQYSTQASGNQTEGKVKMPGAYTSDGEGIVCDRSHSRTDICSAFGRVQMDARSSLFLLNAVNESNHGIVEKIRPYTRKWESEVMDLVREVTLEGKAVQNNFMLKCDVQHGVPAVVFSTGGYTGNVYHEFNDGIVPLYITSQHLKREVVLINVDCRNWWLTKYDEVLNQLTKYRVINFDNETKIHCFPEVTIGVFIHAELTIDPTLMPNNETVLDFRAMLERAYTPHYVQLEKKPVKRKRPNLVILVREGSREIVNLNQVVKLAKQIGFNVTLWKPLPTTDLKDTYRLLNSSHVLMGVHGAALTHFLFMPPGSVFIQIIPLGIDWASQSYFGDPAERMGLQYIGYKIGLLESTLNDKYGKEDTVLVDPMTIVSQGWSATKEIYLDSQDVRLDLPRFKNTLMDAKRRAMRLIRQQRMKGNIG
ncbi:hypothetical protein KI387_022954 [Taxus chinensis]|uniref:Glycosyltransferase 61 catalytic domain-containing protein n=1 Tax=Taxus chinensis TaxID=29808 RepID=A0AA38G0W5_TAXCH|nr:hypothetical protein KI387_022954 [Taxus chinensis]